MFSTNAINEDDDECDDECDDDDDADADDDDDDDDEYHKYIYIKPLLQVIH